MKKLVSVVLVLAMMAVIMTGCGGSSDGGNSTAGQKAEETAETTEVNNDAYVVLVTDADGAPVAGASVQFCSDTQCIMEKTDDTGIAVFKQDPGKYTVHVLKAEGYVVTDEEYAVPEEYGIVKIVLEKQ